MSALLALPLLPAGFSFRDPPLLLFCLLAPLCAWLALRAGGRLTFSSLAALPPAKSRRSPRVRLAALPPILIGLGALLLGVALAGPRAADRSERVRRQGIAIMMVVDTSGSMAALDLSTPERERTRLDAVREEFLRFVQGGDGLPGRPDDLVGVVSFAGYADTRCPLTLDHDNLALVAQQLEITTNPEDDGTALGDGLGLALERLRETPARSRVAILLTDGVNNRGETTPEQAAELAATVGVRVYTVGAGTNGTAPIRVQGPFGQSVLTRVPVEIDEAVLQSIAQRTGGRYYRAGDALALHKVYEDIDRLERSEIVEERLQRYREFYRPVAAAGLACLFLAFLLGGTLLRRLP